MPRTLLLADDSVTIQKVVQITFAAEDTQVVAVDNGEDALQKAREIRPDIILADVVMPRRNGYDLAQAIKADGALRNIPVLLLTGSFEPFDEARASAAQADGHIVKPFDSQALIDKVNELTGGRPAAAVAPAARAAPSPTQLPWSAPAATPFRPSAPAAPSGPGPIRTPAPLHPPTAMPRAPVAPPVVPSLSPMPGMRPGAPATGGMPGFSVSRPSGPSTATPPPTLGTPALRPSGGLPPGRPDPFAGLPPSGAGRPPVAQPPMPLPLTSVVAPRAPAPAAPSRPAPWPGQPTPAQRPPQPAVPAASAAPPAARSFPSFAPPTPAPAAPTARPTVTGWDTLGPSFEDDAPAPPAPSGPSQTRDAAYMAEAAAAASVQAGPGDSALDVALDEDGPEAPSPLQTVSTPGGYDLGGDSSYDLGMGQEPMALHSGTLADLAQTSRMPQEGIELSEEDGDAGDRLELAAPHEFMGGPPAPSTPLANAARPRPVAPPVASRPSVEPLRPAASASTAPSADPSEAALRAALSSASREVIERVVWEVVPQLVEVIVREHVERLAQSRDK